MKNLKARHRCDISSQGAVLVRRNNAEIGPANSLHASAYYSEYNEKFELIKVHSKWLEAWTEIRHNRGNNVSAMQHANLLLAIFLNYIRYGQYFLFNSFVC